MFSATPAKGKRSRSKRPTISAIKCWASAAGNPPLPQAKILPLLLMVGTLAQCHALVALLGRQDFLNERCIIEEVLFDAIVVAH